MNDDLTQDQKFEIRKRLIAYSEKLIGIEYEYGASWENFSELPHSLDCSEMVKGLYRHFGLKMPDGSQFQFDFSIESSSPVLGDLAFFGRDANPKKVYHVGIVFDNEQIIEARAFDKSAYFDTGKVILRPIDKWIKYKNFVGFRSHPKLV